MEYLTTGTFLRPFFQEHFGNCNTCTAPSPPNNYTSLNPPPPPTLFWSGSDTVAMAERLADEQANVALFALGVGRGIGQVTRIRETR